MPLGVGYLFLVGSNILQLTVVQQRVVILEFLEEKMSTHPSTLPSQSHLGEGVRSLRFSESSLGVNWQSYPFHNLLQQSYRYSSQDLNAGKLVPESWYLASVQCCLPHILSDSFPATSFFFFFCQIEMPSSYFFFLLILVRI